MGHGLGRAGGYGVMVFGARRDLVNQPPVDGALAADAFFQRTEEIGPVAAYLAFVRQTGQAAGAGQNCQQGHFR